MDCLIWKRGGLGTYFGSKRGAHQTNVSLVDDVSNGTQPVVVWQS
jgi:hypothetical protein